MRRTKIDKKRHVTREVRRSKNIFSQAAKVSPQLADCYIIIAYAFNRYVCARIGSSYIEPTYIYSARNCTK